MQTEEETNSIQLQSNVTVSTVVGRTRLDIFGLIHHIPGHWVCRSMLGISFQPDKGLDNIVYYYDDLTGSATLNKIEESSLDDTVSGLVYIRNSIITPTTEYKVGVEVNCYDNEVPIVQGTVVTCLKITRALAPQLEMSQFNRAGKKIYAQDSVGCFAVFALFSLSPTYKSLDSSSEATSDYDLDVQRVISKTRRQAQQF